MKTKTLAAAALVLAITLCLCLLPGFSSPSEWINFSSPEGRFSILMPGKPTIGTIDLPIGNTTVTAHSFTSLDPPFGIMCGYADFAAIPGDVEKVFDGTRNGSISNVQGTLITERKLTQNGCPGRRFRSTARGNSFIDEEMYLVGKRLYLITILTRSEVPDKRIEKVLASFQFTPQAR